MSEDQHNPSIRHARALLAQLADTTGLTGTTPPPPPAPVEKFVPFYPDAQAWVTHHYTVMYVRRLKNGQRWCSRWYEHPEALMRFEALWRTWEQARLTDLIGTSLWLRTELDHHLPILHAGDGPFAGCVDGKHRLPSPAIYPVADSDPSGPDYGKLPAHPLPGISRAAITPYSVPSASDSASKPN